MLYPVLWGCALVFTQMLRNSISNAFFWFVCIFPLLSILYSLIARSFIQVYVTSNTVRTDKRSPVSYEIRLINSSPVPLTRIEAFVIEPRSDGVKCSRKKLVCSLVSFGSCIINNTVSFPYRGSYDIGVESIYAYSVLGMVAFRLDVDNYAHVTVFPRKLSLERDIAKEMTDDAQTSAQRKRSADMSEPSDIKDYTPGDLMKSIHWKLTSKSEEIKVRRYDSVEQKHTYIFCDLAEAEKLPEKTPKEVYENVKALLTPKKSYGNRKIRTLRTRIAALEKAKDESVSDKKNKRNAFSGIIGYFRMKKAETDYRKNIKSGMTEEQADTVRMVDSLIASTSKNSLIRNKKKKNKADKAQRVKTDVEMSLEKEERLLFEKEEREQAELDRILKGTEDREVKLSLDEKLFGGRILSEYLSDYDELCADSVVELTVALAYDEILCGNHVTIAWFDPREDSGIYTCDFDSSDEFEPVYVKLSTAPVVSADNKVSNLLVSVTDNNTSKIKVVTSNIDPFSLAEIEQIPAKLGGAGSGCNAEVLVVSHPERYEDKAARAAFAADAEKRLISRGTACNIWTVREDRFNKTVFTVV